MELDTQITPAEFAALVGVTPQAVGHLLKNGVLARGQTGREWLHSYVKRLRLQAAGRLGKGDGALDLATERALLARAQRTVLELRAAETRGELVRAESVRQVWAKRIVNTRDALLLVPHRLSAALAAETDPDRVGRIIEDEIHSVMLQMSAERG